MGLQGFSQSLNALFPKSLQWGQSLGGVKLLALLQYSAACTSKLQELSRANSESRCFIISPSSKSQVLKHGRNCTVLLFQISGEKLGNFNALQVWNKFSKITRPGILSLFSTPSFSWASTVSEYLLHGKAVPEYSGQPFYLWTRYLLNRTQSQKFRGAFNFSHFPFSCLFFFFHSSVMHWREVEQQPSRKEQS